MLLGPASGPKPLVSRIVTALAPQADTAAEVMELKPAGRR
jgi:hypothetical protein